MSVLIKGMKMPTCCAECPCLRHDSIDGRHMYQCNVTLGIKKDISKKPRWCPLVDLGKHGRLIDADEVYSSCVEEGQRSRRYKLGETWELNGYEIRRAIENVPTVIEAEEGEG